MAQAPLSYPVSVNRRAIFFIASLGSFMATLDSSIVNVAVPDIMAHYHAAISEVEWVITASMIGFAAWIPLTAWLRDHLGNLRLYAASVTIFTFSSALCGLAPTLEFLIAARVLQALGGGALTPMALAMIADVYGKEERARVVGWWGLIVVFGPAVGPAVGGVLTQYWGWPAVFYVNVPIGFLLLLASLRYIPDSRPAEIRSHPFQIFSFVTLLVSTVSLLYGISRLPRHGATKEVLAAFCLAVIAGALFYGDWRRKGRAILDLALFSYRDFRASIILTWLRSLTLHGSLFLVPIFLQGPRGLSETTTGFVLGFGALLLALMMAVSGRILGCTTIRTLVLIGMIGGALYCFCCFLWAPTTTMEFIVTTMIIRGVGIGLMVTPLSTLIINATPAPKAGMASAIMSLCYQLAGALGVALFAGLHDLFLQRSGNPSAAFAWAFFVAGAMILAGLPLAARLPRTPF